MSKVQPSGARGTALIALFAVMSIALDSMVTPGFSSGIWFGWVFVMSPITGIVLGPRDGFFATLISVLIGHSLVFRGSIFEFIFTLGAPLGSAVSGMIFMGERGKVLAYYAALLVAYFLTPVAWSLPLWGMWDVYLAVLVLLALIFLEWSGRKDLVRSPRIIVALSTLIGLEADVLFRIFILIPCRGYSVFYGLTPEVLAMIWSIPAPLITSIKVAISASIATLLIPSILRVLKKNEFGIGLSHSDES
jgi:hypothetical protein